MVIDLIWMKPNTKAHDDDGEYIIIITGTPSYAWSDNVSSKVLMGFHVFFGLGGEYLSPPNPKYPWNPSKTFELTLPDQA